MSCKLTNASQPGFVCNPKTLNWVKITASGKTVIKNAISAGDFDNLVFSKGTDIDAIKTEYGLTKEPTPPKIQTTELPKSSESTPKPSVIETVTSILIKSPNKMVIRLPYQTALRAFRAMQKLHRREVGGNIYINVNKKFEYATFSSGQGGSVAFPKDAEIIYHTHPDSRSNKVYYDPPSFTDVINHIREVLYFHMGEHASSPQLSIVFTNEGVYTIEVDPEKVLSVVSAFKLTSVTEIISLLTTIWGDLYSGLLNQMMNNNKDKLSDVNKLLKGVTITLHRWEKIVKNKGFDVCIQPKKFVKMQFNPGAIEPETAPKPFVPPSIKPIHY
jgi:hypothetical protein